MEQICQFENTNVALPPLPKRGSDLPACVCNYNAKNITNNILSESGSNSTEQRSFDLTNTWMYQMTDGDGKKYLNRVSYSSNPNSYYTYDSYAENPFNIGLGSLRSTYGVNFTFVSKGRVFLGNRSDFGGWDKYNNLFLIGTERWYGTSETCRFMGTGVHNFVKSDTDIISIRATTAGATFTNHTTDDVRNVELNNGFDGQIPTDSTRLSTCFILGGSAQVNESADTHMYWFYYSHSILTDAEIQRVINYNN